MNCHFSFYLLSCVLVNIFIIIFIIIIIIYVLQVFWWNELLPVFGYGLHRPVISVAFSASKIL